MDIIISHNNANSQAGNPHYLTDAIKANSSSLSVMKKTEIRDKISQRHRAAIRAAMKKHGLKVSPWCKDAGITEGALRNFLNGDNESMGVNNLELLASAINISIGELLGEEIHYKVDDDLMQRAAISIISAAKKKGLKLSRAQEMAYTVMLYNHAIEYRRQGHSVEPNEAMAVLFLKNTA